MEQQPLAIYLRNHEAAALAGRDLFRRTAANQRDRPYADELAELSAEVEQDVQALQAAMGAVRVTPDLVQGLALRLGERIGRLKPNGSLLGRAPLSDLIEIEGLLDAVRAKAAGWQALSQVSEPDWSEVADTQALYERALDQAERLNAIHRQVAARLFTA
jgi:PHD/YefM family antitoxin component YafN of YafNO toxin-antitoxin module